MSKTTTKAAIDANIRQNGQQLITGQILNSVLNLMVDDYASQEVLSELLSRLDDFSINIDTGVLTYKGKHFQLIAIEDEIYTGAICGRAICGQAICGTI